jgi:hypothetical protein
MRISGLAGLQKTESRAVRREPVPAHLVITLKGGDRRR